jgi:hypothetical protein
VLITLTQTNGQPIRLDTFAIREFYLNPTDTSVTDVLYYAEGAIASIATVTELPAAILKLSPFFFSVTDVSRSMGGVGITATIPFTAGTGTIAAGDKLTVNGVNAGIVSANSGGNLTVTGFNAPLPLGAAVVGYANGNTVTGVGAYTSGATYTYAYTNTRYLNGQFRNTYIGTAGVGAVNQIRYYNEDASLLDNVYVSDTLAVLTLATNGTGTATQGTSATTTVVLNSGKGVITSFASTLAAGASSRFTVTNTYAVAGAFVQVSVVDYSGTFTTNGLPIVAADTVTTGSFDIILANAHGANALSGTVGILFEIINP